MTDRSPLPPGTTEPDPIEVRLGALELLIRRIYVRLPPDALRREAEALKPTLTTHNLANATQDQVLDRRSMEAASEILMDVWISVQDHLHMQAVANGEIPELVDSDD